MLIWLNQLGWRLLATSVFFMVALSATAQETAQQTYQRLCAVCHGEQMQGGMASSLVDGQWEFGRSRSYRFRNIADGISDRGMPAYRHVLSEEQINGLLDLIEQRTEAGGGATRSAEPETQLSTFEYGMAAEVFVDGLSTPWAIDWIDAETALVTERPGTLRVVRGGELQPEPVKGTPQVLHQGQGGLLDVAVDPNYSENGWIYLAYSHALEGERSPAMTRVVRGRIRDHAWIDEQVVYEAPHETYLTTRHHYGTRIVFDPESYLYFSIGDRGRMNDAQQLDRPNGKIHRLHRDGRVPEDNPFVGREGALGSIYSYGHRNPQGLAINPETGRLWSVEHGPRGGDELHLIRAGANYGWPVISYGLNYDGSVLTGRTQAEGMEQPIFYWNPSPALCGLDFYRGELFPRWRHRLLASALRFEEVQLLNLFEERVMHTEVILKGRGRVREAVAGPDGAIYVVTNQPDRILRLTPTSATFGD